MVDVVILAGGKGSRMSSDVPKALMPVRGVPMVSYHIGYFSRFDPQSRIILSLGHKSEDVIDYVGKAHNGCNVDFAVESEPLGTAGGMRLALSKSISQFVVALNCDDIADIDLRELAKNTENTLCIAKPRMPFGRVLVNGGYVERFDEKPLLDDFWVSCGWYLFDRHMLLDVLPRKGSLEYDFFPKVSLRAFEHRGFWKPLNMKKDIDEFENMVLPDSIKGLFKY